MKKLMDFQEMEKKYNSGQDSLELTIEKWTRIYEFLQSAFTLGHFDEALQAAVVPIFLCVEYRDRCEYCPLFMICRKGTSEEFNKVLRILQAYNVAGDMLPIGPLMGVVEIFLEELKMCQSDVKGKAH
jgi:hypothetical protein